MNDETFIPLLANAEAAMTALDPKVGAIIKRINTTTVDLMQENQQLRADVMDYRSRINAALALCNGRRFIDREDLLQAFFSHEVGS